ncbi:glycosyltransferase involved in cell wall biosynthesis [Vibrio crassostreae]|nr:glycosyltransferase involved in cell wall biosynthesis [Vibrio crassostreae]
MNIWFVNQYASNPELGAPGRHYFLAKSLKKYKCNVTIIASSFNHLRKINKTFGGLVKTEFVDDIRFLWFRVFSYNKSSSLLRVLNWVLFSIGLLFTPFILKRPNIIVYSSPSLFGYYACYFLSKIYKCKLVFEVRDIWPRSLVDLAGINESNPLIKFMSITERFAYKSSFRVWSNLQFSYRHMLNNGLKCKSKFSWYPNGVQPELYNIEHSKKPISESYRDICEIQKSQFVIGYIGTLGEANALDNFLKAIKYYNDVHGDSAFVIIGNGYKKESLITYAESNNIKNLYFFDSVDFLDVKYYINLFDVCFLGTQALQLYEFGVASLKLPEYMLSQKPIIHASYNSAVENADCGIVVLPDKPRDLAEAFSQMKSLPDSEREAMGLKGMNFAMTTFNYEAIAYKMYEEISNYDEKTI